MVCGTAVECSKRAESTIRFTLDDICESISLACRRILGTDSEKPSSPGAAALSEAIVLELFSLGGSLTLSDREVMEYCSATDNLVSSIRETALSIQ